MRRHGRRHTPLYALAIYVFTMLHVSLRYGVIIGLLVSHAVLAGILMARSYLAGIKKKMFDYFFIAAIFGYVVAKLYDLYVGVIMSMLLFIILTFDAYLSDP